ncbi:MAG: PGF-CTERM sorting domain-containing protein [Halovenus sp.]
MSQSRVVAATLGVGVLVLAAVAVGGVAAQEQGQITVEVNLVDQNGNGVGEAELTATWEGGENVATTTSGGLALLEVEEGADVEISVDHPRYVRNQPYVLSDVTVPSEEDRLQVEIPVSLSGTASIVVKDADGPVEDVRVRVREDFGDQTRVQTLETSPNGVAETDELERGQYTVTTSIPRYFDAERTLAIDENRVSESITIERGFVDLTVEVTDDHFDPPQALPDATVEIEDDTFSTRGDGTRTVDVAVNDRFEVTVSRDGYESVTETISIAESPRTLDVSIQRTPELNIESSQERIVIGESTTVTVTNAYDEPVPGATVSLDGTELGETDSNGEFDVEISEAGERTISVSGDGVSSSVTVEGIDPDADDDEQPAESEGTDSIGPGFGVVATLVAVLAIALLAGRR